MFLFFWNWNHLYIDIYTTIYIYIYTCNHKKLFFIAHLKFKSKNQIRGKFCLTPVFNACIKNKNVLFCFQACTGKQNQYSHKFCKHIHSDNLKNNMCLRICSPLFLEAEYISEMLFWFFIWFCRFEICCIKTFEIIFKICILLNSTSFVQKLFPKINQRDGKRFEQNKCLKLGKIWYMSDFWDMHSQYPTYIHKFKRIQANYQPIFKQVSNHRSKSEFEELIYSFQR